MSVHTTKFIAALSLLVAVGAQAAPDDESLTIVDERTYSTTTIKLPVLCRNERARPLCRNLSNYFTRIFEQDLITRSNERIDFDDPDFDSFKLHGRQNVYLFFLHNTDAPLTTLYAVIFQYVPGAPDRRIVQTFNFDREEEHNLSFSELFEDSDLAAMLVARFIEKEYQDSQNPMKDLLIAATEYNPTNFIVVKDGLRFFFAPGLVNTDMNLGKIHTVKIPLSYLQEAGPKERWWPASADAGTETSEQG